MSFDRPCIQRVMAADSVSGATMALKKKSRVTLLLGSTTTLFPLLICHAGYRTPLYGVETFEFVAPTELSGANPSTTRLRLARNRDVAEVQCAASNTTMRFRRALTSAQSVVLAVIAGSFRRR